MRKTFNIVAILGLVLAVPAVALEGTLGWQTTPILGTNQSNATGDVVMITGPTPTQAGGGFYYDVDGNLVLGPTIPHYSIAGDPLFGVGSPSMTEFLINPNVFDGGHWYDPNLWVCSGSGVYLDKTATYTYTGTWAFLGNGLNPPYTAYTFTNTSFSEPEGFIMLMSGFGGSLPEPVWHAEDVGRWNYTETWTDNAVNGASITSSNNFNVVVPLPAAAWGGIVLLGTLAGTKGLKRLRRQQA